MKFRLPVLTVLAALLVLPAASAIGPQFEADDLFVATNNDAVEWYRAGSLVTTLTMPSASEKVGMAFGPTGNLFVSMFGQGTIAVFDTSGASLGSFATLTPHPGGVAVGPDGTVYVANYPGGGSDGIDKFDSLGNPLGHIATSDAGAFVAISRDGCSLYHAHFFTPVYSTDLCGSNGEQFFAANNPGGNADYNINIVPILGGVIVGSNDGVYRYDVAGNLVQSYDVGSGEASFGVAADSTGTTLWVSGYYGGTVRQYNIATGAFIGQVATGPNDAIAVFGGGAGPNAPTPELPTLALLGMGVGLVGIVALRRK